MPVERDAKLSDEGVRPARGRSGRGVVVQARRDGRGPAAEHGRARSALARGGFGCETAYATLEAAAAR